MFNPYPQLLPASALAKVLRRIFVKGFLSQKSDCFFVLPCLLCIVFKCRLVIPLVALSTLSDNLSALREHPVGGSLDNV